MTGAIVWFTGLPSSGKSRLARRVQARLGRECMPCCLLDGDRVRSLLHPQPGYSSAERDDFYRTLGGLALELAQQGLIVLVPATANQKQYRDRIRAQAPRFIEVWMTATLDECRLRDAKRLYAQSGARSAGRRRHLRSPRICGGQRERRRRRRGLAANRPGFGSAQPGVASLNTEERRD
jgi:adenylylsulfate kinase